MFIVLNNDIVDCLLFIQYLSYVAPRLFHHCVPVDVGKQSQAKPDHDEDDNDDDVFSGGDHDFCKE